MRLSITHLFFLAAAPAIAITGPKGPARFPLTVPRGGANNVQHLSSKTTVQQNPQVATSLKGGAQEYATSISSMRFNLVKGIVGAGVLSLPAGIAAFGDAPGAVIPAVALIIAIGMVSAYGFSLIGRVCSLTGARSYREAWEKSVGPSTSVLPAATCTFKTFVAILSYSMILADTFKNLLSTLGYEFGRTNVLLGVTSVVILPLCLMKNLSSLAPFSLAGIIGMAYTAIAMAVRYFGPGYKLPDGKFLPDVAENLQPVFGSSGASAVISPSSFILISMLSTAYMAHFNAPRFFQELETLERFNTVVSSSFAAAISIFATVAALGFLTFGKATSGLVLNNYANTDTVMSLSRFAVAFSIVFSYPLAFVGCRDGVLDLMNVGQEKRTDAKMNQVTLALVALVTFMAIKVKDLTFVLSFGGATLGNALIYVYPALMFRSAIKNMGDKADAGLKSEVNVALTTAAIGVVMGVIGANMALKQ